MRQVTSLQLAFAEFQPIAVRNPAYAQRTARRLRDVRAIVAAMVEQACARLGLTLPIASEEFATIVVALVEGFGVHHGLDPDGSSSALLSDALEYLWHGMLVVHPTASPPS